MVYRVRTSVNISEKAMFCYYPRRSTYPRTSLRSDKDIELNTEVLKYCIMSNSSQIHTHIQRVDWNHPKACFILNPKLLPGILVCPKVSTKNTRHKEELPKIVSMFGPGEVNKCFSVACCALLKLHTRTHTSDTVHLKFISYKTAHYPDTLAQWGKMIWLQV